MPVVLIEKIKGALRLAAVDPAAAKAGLSPGLTLADARARVPALRTLPHRPEADAALLARVLEDFDRFTPMIALDAPHGLMLDITGCAHLFGGEAGLVEAVEDRARRIGLQIRAALADTPQAARALARFGPARIFIAPTARDSLRRLPVAALEMSEAEESALRRAGLKRLGDLDDRPKAPLAARFGAGFPARLARILGDEDIRITPHRAPPPIVVDRVFFEPISNPDFVEQVLTDLLIEAADRLDQLGHGGRAFGADFYRVDGQVRRVVVQTGRPTRDPPSLVRLYRERLGALSNPLDPGFGFDQMRLSVLVTEPLAPSQRGLDGDRPGDEDFSRLIDRLTARLGPEAVLRFQALGSYIPERAGRLVPASLGASLGAGQAAWPDRAPEAPPLRPLQMFHPPQPVETLAEVPDGSPLRFRWRRVLHQVVRAEGPERIAGEWWRAPDQKTRDYYRVEDSEGRRFWLFRQGLYGEAPEPRWFIHGLFP
ncbi:DNA polymerase Y family protein [Phenylobacterium sp.]|uniref:Y-family DNA polymerase n=1 Tax=Phenylobacterium sp. TaxID=1871053 RepID=UPI00272FB1DB|nr:DNA polymerase Y family protein [Phenylobacterium sp.]MDP1618465.1 DNA polymerase Y family protein [Phenylobacterium sp.]MDP1985983.1 DNA polymerase Y family protein [Phenylobacterium sp.]